jgi:hypothetical protein
MDYIKIYNQICQRAKNELYFRLEKKQSGEYFESHHITPKCLGGKGKNKDYKHENIALLTAREHFLYHWLLCEAYPKYNSLKIAFWSMCYTDNKNHRRNYIPSSRIVELAKLKMLEGIKNRKSGRKGKAPWNKSMVLSDEKYKVGGKKNKGRKLSNSAKNKVSISLLGNNRSSKKIIDKTNLIIYDSITSAAKALNTNRNSVYKLLKSNLFEYA